MQLSSEQLFKVVLKEINRHKVAIVAIFTVISLLMLLVGSAWPKRYTVSTTILSESQNMNRQLLEGRAATSNFSDDVRLARELVYSQKIMKMAMTEAGLINETTSPANEERLIDDVKKRTEVSRIGDNLIKIEFRDSDPKIAHVITKQLANLFIEQAVESQRQESIDSYQFIDTQVKEYHAKLTDAEQKLKEARSENVSAVPGADTEVATRIASLRRRIEQARLELREEEIKKKSLESQLSGEAEITTVLSREGQYRNRIAELQGELDTLRLTYHDSYPDVVRVRHQIEDLKQSIKEERARREEVKQAVKAGHKVELDENITLSPLYQQLRSGLSQTKTQIATLRSRITENDMLLKEELKRAIKIHDVEAVVAELTRDYNVNRDIYQDLLRRRENARVSMNLGDQQQGPSLKIQEPARLPIRPSGLRFLHFMIGGIALGLALPIGLLYAGIMFDPRIKSEAQLADKLKLTVLATVPYMNTAEEKSRDKKQLIILGVVLCMVFVTYIAVGIMKYYEVI